MPTYDPANPTYDPVTKLFGRGQLYPQDMNQFRLDLLAEIAAMQAAGGPAPQPSPASPASSHFLLRSGTPIVLRNGAALAQRTASVQQATPAISSHFLLRSGTTLALRNGTAVARR